MRYFMEKEYGEMVYAIDEFKDRIYDGEKEIILLEMKRDYGGEMWCRENKDFVGKGDCGCFCTDYNPCNGKNGRCRYLENGFVETGKDFILTESGLREILK